MLTSDYLYAASSFRRTVILASSVLFFCTIIEAVSKWQLTLVANPDQPFTGDTITLTCKGMIHPSTTSLSFNVLHTLNEEVTTYVFKAFPTGDAPIASVSTEHVGCYAADHLCDGISSRFSYSDNGSLAIVVVIRSFVCRLRGLWTCSIIFRYAHDIGNIYTKASLTFQGFSWPSNLTLTVGDSHKDINQVAVVAGSKVMLTCRANVGSTDARLIFVSYSHNNSEIVDAEWFNASKEINYKQTECQWIHEATFDLTVLNKDDLKNFKCGVKGNHHIILTSSPITLYVVNGPGMIWHSMSKGHAKDAIISDPAPMAMMLTEKAKEVRESNCFHDVWLVFGVVAVSVVVIVIIMESASSVYKKVKEAQED